MKLLVSACLLGEKVRYDAKGNLRTHPRLQTLIDAGRVVPFCPEVAGGLPIPRAPAEIQGQKTGADVLLHDADIRTREGADVTQAFIEGAHKALAVAQKHGIRVALLKARSPSCGSSEVYDGSFSKSLIPGMGVTAALLSQNDIQIFDEDHIDEAINALEGYAS